MEGGADIAGLEACVGIRERNVATMRKALPDSIGNDRLRELEEGCWLRALEAERLANKTKLIPTAGSGLSESRRSVVQAAYAQACRNAVANLSTDSTYSNGNRSLLNAVTGGKVNIAKVPAMSADELSPGSGYAAPRRCRASADAVASDAFECPWCEQRKCVHYELQTRSADEATTIFITCIACGHRWTE